MINGPMTEAERDKAAYHLAKQFLLGINVPGVTPELVSRYLNPSVQEQRPTTLNGIYRRILESAQNANMKAGVIGGSIGGVAKLGIVLFDFDAKAVVDKYGRNWAAVFDDIRKHLKPRGALRVTSRSIWPRYCRSILSGASFISQFASAEEFYQWVTLFDVDEKTRPALPMLLANEIEGFGFALACDFLKELGYFNFGKPDVHLRQIFEALHLCAPRASDYQVFKAILRVALNTATTPYAVDKLFWLIGSGYFYDHSAIGKNGRTGNRKEAFITFAHKNGLD